MWAEERGSMSLRVPAVVAHDSLRQAAGTSAGLSVEAFGMKKKMVHVAPWNLGCSQHKDIWRERRDHNYRG